MQAALQPAGDAAYMIGDGRFDPVISRHDVFHGIEQVEGELDLSALTAEARRSAESRASKVMQGLAKRSDGCAVWDFLQLSHYRKGARQDAGPYHAYVADRVRACQAARRPVTFTVSLFPCKVRQPLKTFAKSGAEVDIGELASLVRIFEIAYGVSCCHEFGSRFMICCDGHRYQTCFGDRTEAILGYRANLQRMIDWLGVSDHVTLIDESEFLDNAFWSKVGDEFDDLCQKYFKGESLTHHKINAIVKNTILNLDTETTDLSIQDMTRIYLSINDLNANNSHEVLGRRDSMIVRGTFAALRYVAINDVMTKMRIHDRFFPYSLKTTVHPKPFQLGIHAVNRNSTIFPHCGQGVVKSADRRAPVKLSAIRVDFSANLMRRNVATRGMFSVVLDPARYPFSDGIHPFAVVLPNAV